MAEQSLVVGRDTLPSPGLSERFLALLAGGRSPARMDGAWEAAPHGAYLGLA
jgi:hypothetical protein